MEWSKTIIFYSIILVAFSLIIIPGYIMNQIKNEIRSGEWVNVDQPFDETIWDKENDPYWDKYWSGNDTEEENDEAFDEEDEVVVVEEKAEV
jgi:hypothetical protein